MAARNITLRVPEDVYRAARIRAAREGTSISAMVAKYLSTITEDDAEYRRLEALQDAVVARIGTFRASDRLDRDAAHARAVR